jgi:hypothetical protein
MLSKNLSMLALLIINGFMPISTIAADQAKLQQNIGVLDSADPEFQMGLTIDETFTKPGHDFYQIFYQQWQPTMDEQLTIRIHEQPTFARAGYISLWVDQDLIYRGHLTPRYEDIEVNVKQAIEQLHQYLYQKLFIKKQLEFF